VKFATAKLVVRCRLDDSSGDCHALRSVLIAAFALLRYDLRRQRISSCLPAYAFARRDVAVDQAGEVVETAELHRALRVCERATFRWLCPCLKIAGNY
jgi:hypothetical protein